MSAIDQASALPRVALFHHLDQLAAAVVDQTRQVVESRVMELQAKDEQWLAYLEAGETHTNAQRAADSNCLEYTVQRIRLESALKSNILAYEHFKFVIAERGELDL